MRRIVIVNDKMQQGYRYELSASVGRDFDPQFRPDLTPKQMLELGVFCGKYLTDCRDEYPASWFARAKLSRSGRDCSLNYFGVDASQPWTPFCLSSGNSCSVDLPATLSDEREDLSGEVTLQGSNGVEFGMPFGYPTSNIVLGSLVGP